MSNLARGAKPLWLEPLVCMFGGFLRLGFYWSLGFGIWVFPTRLLAADHLQEIQTRGILLWGADAEGGAPYVYPNPEKPEQLIGFEYDLAEALAAKLGVKAKMVQNQWDQLVPALDRGNFDIILNGLEITADNQQHIALSLPYFIYAQQIITRKETEGLTRM